MGSLPLSLARAREDGYGIILMCCVVLVLPAAFFLPVKQKERYGKRGGLFSLFFTFSVSVSMNSVDESKGREREMRWAFPVDSFFFIVKFFIVKFLHVP